MGAVNRDVSAVFNDLQSAWSGVRSAIAKLGTGTDIRPNNVAAVFGVDARVDGGVRITAGPIVFHVPEKPSSSGAELYVVLSGWLVLSPKPDHEQKRYTRQFGTKVGYFRQKGAELTHVYGTHYDMDEQLPGHPVFHAQMCSQAGFAEHIAAEYHTTFGAPLDLSEGLLANVRTPTAQMDVFSVITQIGADHFVSETSAPEIRRAFGDLRSACDFFYGAAGQLSYLNEPPASQCYRSTHWYERSASAD